MSDWERGTESVKPVFVDNRDGNTLARAITTHLAALRRDGRTPAELCVASCYFNPQGLELIASEARHVPRIRLLLGAAPTPEALLPRRTPYDPAEPEFTRRRVSQELAQLERGLKRDRDLLPFDLEEDRAIRSLLDFLRSGRIEVRRYEGHFLHAKAFLFRGAERGILALCTDVLAEGMNLQQCRNVVNYDLPWNPMRLVQRHGRVDRIGSPHETVFLRTFFPDAQLDALLNLEERVRRKLAQAAASVGVEEAPIERGATGEQSFADTREEIEKLHRQDASIYEAGGTEGAAQTGEEYRQELRRALARYGDRIRNLPWRSGSGMRKGEQAGHLFCAMVGERVYLRFVPRKADAGIIGELGTCLRFLECTEATPRVLSAETTQAAYAAWAAARRSIFDAWTFETDPANLQPKIRRLNRDVAAFLRSNPPSGIEQERLHRCLDAVESPWPRREENLLRLAWERERATSGEKARHLVEEVERIGAEPFHSPDPLPPIAEDEIHLVTWMAIERGTAESAG